MATTVTNSTNHTPASTLNRRRFTLALYRWRNLRVPLRGDRYAGPKRIEADSAVLGSLIRDFTSLALWSVGTGTYFPVAVARSWPAGSCKVAVVLIRRGAWDSTVA